MNAPKPASSSVNVQFLGFVTDAENHKILQQFVLARGWDEGRARMGNIDEAVSYLSSHPTPDFLLVDVKDAAEAPSALDKLADVCASHVKVIVTSTVDEFSFFRWLKDIGVHHYLLKPFTVENLTEVLSQPVETGAKPVQSNKEGKLITVLGTRGGVGASTLALNLASAFSMVRDINTGLLDLEPHWGTISLMMDLEPGRGLRDALAKPDRVDSLFMERVMLKYAPNFAILSSEEPLDETITVHPDAAGALLKESRQKFDMVVADLPHHINSFTQDMLKASNQIVIATELTLVSLRDAMRLSDYVKGKLGIKQVHFVANRQGMLPKSEIPQGEFEKSLGVPFLGVIPFEAEHYAKMAGSHLAVDKKAHSPMAKAVVGLADKLHPPLLKENGHNGPAKAKKTWKWLSIKD